MSIHPNAAAKRTRAIERTIERPRLSAADWELGALVSVHSILNSQF